MDSATRLGGGRYVVRGVLGEGAQGVTYDALDSLERDVPTVYVDMAGSAPVRGAVHTHLVDALKYSCAVGGTHWDALSAGASGGPKLPGPRPTLFFAPAQVKKRNADWGPSGLQQRINDAWHGFMVPVRDPARGWLKVIRDRGPAAVERVYREVLEGRAKPNEGPVLSL